MKVRWLLAPGIALALFTPGLMADTQDLQERSRNLDQDMFSTDIQMMPVVEEGLCLGGDECAELAVEAPEKDSAKPAEPGQSGQ